MWNQEASTSSAHAPRCEMPQQYYEDEVHSCIISQYGVWQENNKYVEKKSFKNLTKCHHCRELMTERLSYVWHEIGTTLCARYQDNLRQLEPGDLYEKLINHRDNLLPVADLSEYDEIELQSISWGGDVSGLIKEQRRHLLSPASEEELALIGNLAINYSYHVTGKGGRTTVWVDGEKLNAEDEEALLWAVRTIWAQHITPLERDQEGYDLNEEYFTMAFPSSYRVGYMNHRSCHDSYKAKQEKLLQATDEAKRRREDKEFDREEREIAERESQKERNIKLEQDRQLKRKEKKIADRKELKKEMEYKIKKERLREAFCRIRTEQLEQYANEKNLQKSVEDAVREADLGEVLGNLNKIEPTNKESRFDLAAVIIEKHTTLKFFELARQSNNTYKLPNIPAGLRNRNRRARETLRELLKIFVPVKEDPEEEEAFDWNWQFPRFVDFFCEYNSYRGLPLESWEVLPTQTTEETGTAVPTEEGGAGSDGK